ncbi:interferon lambda receptor 1 [Lissotriton helveticus]
MTLNMSVCAGSVVFAGLCLLQMVAGQLLQPPQNVHFDTKNFTIIIKWLPRAGYPADVRYTVEHGQGPHPNWEPLHQCQNISDTQCKVTCEKAGYDVYKKDKARVKAAVMTQESPWTESEDNFTFAFDVELGPPQLHVKLAETHMIVHATLHRPTCATIPFLDIKYEWTLWEVEKGFKISEAHLMYEEVNISIAGLHGNYCMVARTTFIGTKEKLSPFSEPLCLQLNQKNTDWSLLLAISVILVVVIVGVICLIMKFKTLPRVKLPASLDLSIDKHSLQPYICDPNDLLLNLSQLSISDPPLRNVDNGYYESLDDHEETSSSCRGYSVKHHYPKCNAPSEDPNETKKYPYRTLPSIRSNDSESTDSAPALEPSGLLNVENTNLKEPYEVESTENSLCELFTKNILPPKGLEMEERRLVEAYSKHTSLPCLCQVPHTTMPVPGGLGVATLSPSNLTLVAKGDIWTNMQRGAINHSQQDICPQLQTPYLMSSSELKKQSMCLLVATNTHIGDVLDNSEIEDWDELLSKAECDDESEPFTETCLSEDSSCDNIQGQKWKDEKGHSAYMSRVC